jgi:hypothetical protein
MAMIESYEDYKIKESAKDTARAIIEKVDELAKLAREGDNVCNTDPAATIEDVIFCINHYNNQVSKFCGVNFKKYLGGCNPKKKYILAALRDGLGGPLHNVGGGLYRAPNGELYLLDDRKLTKCIDKE